MNRIGFIGLGIMGTPMAKNMISKDKQLQLLVYDIDENAINRMTQYGGSYATLKEIGEKCNIIFTILPNGNTVKEVLFNEDGVATNIQPGTVVIDMSSVTPVESKLFGEKLVEKGVHFLDAPVSGGEPKAINGTLSFMVGGEEEIFNKIRPLLMLMGTSAVLVGKVGSGSVTKLANQIIVNLNIAALGEALVFAAKAGVNPQKVFMAIRGGLAGSTVMEAKLPMMLKRDFTPGGKILINHKDIKNVLLTAHELDIPVPMSAQLFEIMQSLKVRDLFEEDHSSLIKYFELLANIEVGEGVE